MKWDNLQVMKCPKCSGNLHDGVMGYECSKCDFFVSYEKFQTLINDLMMPKKKKYDPDRVDRSNWEW